MKRNSHSEKQLSLDILFSSALLSLYVIVLVALLSVPSMDIFLEMAVIGISITIPLLAGSVITYNFELHYKKKIISRMRVACDKAGMIGSGACLAPIFFHFGPYSGIAFSIAGLLVIKMLVSYAAQLESSSKKLSNKK